jgi:hypothetical protein
MNDSSAGSGSTASNRRAGSSLIVMALFISALITPAAYAQEAPPENYTPVIEHWSVSGGLEYNAFSVRGRPEPAVFFQYSPAENRYGFVSLRSAVMLAPDMTAGDLALRVAFLVPSRPQAQMRVRFFFGAEVGLWYTEISGSQTVVTSTSGVAGLRIPIGNHFFIEPHLRAGVPVLFAGGILAGMRFNYAKK